MELLEIKEMRMADAIQRALLSMMPTSELLDKFEWGVREAHYDPLGRMTVEFDLDDLREELVKRLKDSPPGQADEPK